jgi:hypothetical protein
MVLADIKVVNKVWSQWLDDNGHATGTNLYARGLNRDYAKVSSITRQHRECKKFEDWLFTQGVVVIQKDHARYLRFLNEQHATLFLLKWT